MTLKLGKLPPTYNKKDITFSDVSVPTALKEAPVGFGHQGLVPPSAWGMLGNDSVGDCVFAGADHETMLWNAEAGYTPSFIPQNALADYSAVTGYDPNDPSTDQGTLVRDALNYRRHTGVIDATRKRHKIGAFVALEAGNWTQLLEALYIFDCIGIGFEFPASAMDQFNAHKTWSYHRSSPIEGGHYVPVVGRPTKTHLEVVTWGTLQAMTEGFYHHYCDEAWGIVSPEMLNGQGKSPEGLSLSDLNAALAAL